LVFLALSKLMPSFFILSSWVFWIEYNMGHQFILWFSVDKVKEYKVSLIIQRNLRIFTYIIIINLILRIAMYIVCGIVMKGKAPSYAQITP